mmetsp:Transcript_64816/g.180131  ORF Transcript_64816/g.180131 Transcript_64816/m.180131 type:complete len:102 (+) Transcript_64816:1164-1469(+)
MPMPDPCPPACTVLCLASHHIPSEPHPPFPSLLITHASALPSSALSTNLHNKNVRGGDKMSLQAFIQQNRGINGNTNFPADMLAGIYANIAANELRVVRDA